MIYKNLRFPKIQGRPFFYTNFVQTVDGKVGVKKGGYWPIGSSKDHQVLEELRAYADCLIHGSNLAYEFGQATAKSLNGERFKKLRKKLGKDEDLPYYIITTHPDKLSNLNANIVNDSLPGLVKTLQNKGYKHILIEGGPILLGSFLKQNLIDEIFLTIAPRIYGSEEKNTMTLVEGVLFPVDKVKHLKLLSVKRVRDELYLRYSL